MKTLRLSPIFVIRLIAVTAVLLSLVVNVLIGHAAPVSRIPDRPLAGGPISTLRGVQFIHFTTVQNTLSSVSIIDHPLTNNNPNAMILVTPNFNPGDFGTQYDNHPLGVMYDVAFNKWEVFHEDGAAMPVGLSFNVLIPTLGANIFVHTALVSNNSAGSTVIDNVMINNNPDAMIFITANYNPGNVCGCVPNSSATGVSYNTSLHKWMISNIDHTAIAAGVSFNVFIPAADSDVFVHHTTIDNNVGNHTYLGNTFSLHNNSYALVFITPNLSPGGIAAAENNYHTGVWYDSVNFQWSIFNQNISNIMPLNAAFNVMVLPPREDMITHTASPSNIDMELSTVDNYTMNGNPNAVVFAMPVFKPGSVMGNDQVGVKYKDGHWTIANQSLLSIQPNEMFNVILPNPNSNIFIHTTTAANVSGHMTTIDYPLANNNPSAMLIVTLNYLGGVINNHPVGVYYAAGHWNIFNEDLAPMPVGATFNVLFAHPGLNSWVVKATNANIVDDAALIQNGIANFNPNALVFATLNYNPSDDYTPAGLCCVYDTHPIGVRYDEARSLWSVYHQDGSPMAVGTAFNVYVVDRPPHVVSIVRASANPTASSSVDYTVTFSEQVNGVNATDFFLATSGVSGASITNVIIGATYDTATVSVNTGTGNGTIRLDLHDDDSIIGNLAGLLAGDGTLNGYASGETYTVNKTLTLNSIAAQDGWVLESGENSNAGGTLNAGATTLTLGDDAANKQYRAVLSFGTGAVLPDTAVITGVTLKLMKSAVVGGGNPVTIFHGFMADIKNGVFGTSALQTADFQAAASHPYGPFTPALAGNWYNINLTGGAAYINRLAANSGLTQIRLRFQLDDNNNALANTLSLFSGNAPAANRPQLVINYYVP